MSGPSETTYPSEGGFDAVVYRGTERSPVTAGGLGSHGVIWSLKWTDLSGPAKRAFNTR